MLHIIPSDKFKTASVAFYFSIPLEDKCEITAYSLLANVLKRGTTTYPITSRINKRLQDLYGCVLGVGTMKRGDIQVVMFRFEFLSERYAKEGMVRDVLELAKDIVFTEREFNSEYVEQEKANLQELIESQINDKRSYAQKRLIEIMCEGENYAFSEDGYIEELPKLSPKVLELTHKELLKKPLEVFASGDIDGEDIGGLLELMIPDVFDMREQVSAVNRHEGIPSNTLHTERQNITQSKLAMGFSTGITAESKDYAALTVYNEVFGGGVSSLLFNNVREKLSLAYYVGTRIDRFKGIMLLNSGIDNDKFEAAKIEIMAQEARMRSGDFSEKDFDASKLALVNSLKSMLDSQEAMEEFGLRQILSGKPGESVDDVIEGIQRVTIEDVVRLANGIKLETTYLLTGQE